MHIGILLALLSAVLFGASTPLAKILMGSVNPWLMAGLLYLGAGLGLVSVEVFRRVTRKAVAEAPLRSADLPWLAAVIASGGFFGPLCLMFGLARTDAASASLLLNLEGLATMGIAWLAFHENVDKRLLVGAFAILAGAAMLSWQGSASIDWGALLIATACILWGIDNNLTRKLSSADPVQIAMLKGLVAGTVNLTLAFALGVPLPAIGAALAVMTVGFLGYGVSLVLFVLALRHLGTARTGAYFSLAPPLPLALLDEPLTLRLLVAGGLMAVGLWLHLTERHEHKHVHEEIEHEHRHRHDEHHQHTHRPDVPDGEPHSHKHRHAAMTHRHPHFPDIHHRHRHKQGHTLDHS